MKKTSITIPDVAKEAGVSKSTVSLALQDSPKIKPETKRKVVKAAQKLGYVYNRAAANLRRQSSEMIGMVINDLTNPFFAELAVALERYFTDSGYVVMMANTSEDLKQQEKVIRTFCEHGATGILICPAFGTTHNDFALTSARGIPVVSVMRPVEGGDFDHIAPNNYAGSMAITEHLLSQGIQRLAFLGGIPDTSVYKQRLAGFTDAVEKANIDQAEVSVIPCAPTRAAASEALQEHLSRSPQPEGIVCYSDMVAFGAYFGLDLAGLKAGQDIAVAGFDDVLACQTFTPPLTSVHIFTDQLARLAAENLIQRLKDPQRAVSNQTVMPKVVVRESSQLKQP